MLSYYQQPTESLLILAQGFWLVQYTRASGIIVPESLVEQINTSLLRFRSIDKAAIPSISQSKQRYMRQQLELLPRFIQIFYSRYLLDYRRSVSRRLLELLFLVMLLGTVVLVLHS